MLIYSETTELNHDLQCLRTLILSAEQTRGVDAKRWVVPGVDGDADQRQQPGYQEPQKMVAPHFLLKR